MKVVIDIDKKLYDRMKTYHGLDDAYFSIKHGIPLSEDCINCVLDKIRAEIEQLPTVKCTETRRIYINATDFKENVLAILNKYKAESEDK